MFTFRGEKNTEYTAVFATHAEPATVVGVGADITSTSFDADAERLTVQFRFDLTIITEEGKSKDPNQFFIVIDPGAPREFMPRPRPTAGFPPPTRPRSSSLTKATDDTTECYGPASKTTPTADQTGPPLEAAGSWMSTNIASWCIIPPSEDTPFFGFKLVAPPGTKGFFKKKIPAQLLSLLSLLAGKTLDLNSVAVFNGTYEASKSITATSDGGVLIDIKLNFSSTRNDLTDVSNTSSRSLIKAAKASTTVTKAITTAEEESLSLAPTNSQVNGTKAKLFGFVDDPATFAGQKVLIQRKVGSKYKTVGTATINSDGSYSKSIRTNKLFDTSKTSATTKLVATIISGTTRTSRTISLSSKYSSLRQ